jgi:photosystem II stability/assembly factor-like uncharacterized protein
MPTGFKALSVTFVSASEGWVLGSATCSSGRCPAIAHTLDAGGTWSALPAPATTVHADRGLGAAPSGVSGLRFADSLDGWAFGPDLWATHDGGQTWTQVHVTGLSKSPVVALEAGNGLVHAVLYDGHGSFRIASSPVNMDQWTIAPVKLPVGAGPIPTIQLVLSGAAGWVLQNDRTVVNGALLANGVWQVWARPVCASVVGPAFLAASSATDVVAACDVGAFGTPAGEHLFVSTDGGQTFAQTGKAVPATFGEGIASPNTSTVVVAGATGTGSGLFATFNGGRTWQTVVKPSKSTFADLGFTTPTQGVAVTSGGTLLMTRDGGHTWAPVTF